MLPTSHWNLNPECCASHSILQHSLQDSIGLWLLHCTHIGVVPMLKDVIAL